MTAIPQLQPRSPVERVATAVRARHRRYGPALDCDGLTPATNGDDVYCGDCGLVLFRGGSG